jgi:hypothetical protein
MLLERIRYGSHVPPLLATIPPSIGQRRVAGMFMLALLASVLVTWPFATIRLPAIPAFVPVIAAALFISYGVTAVLLFGQFSILRHRALLVIALLKDVDGTASTASTRRTISSSVRSHDRPYRRDILVSDPEPGSTQTSCFVFLRPIPEASA